MGVLDWFRPCRFPESHERVKAERDELRHRLARAEQHIAYQQKFETQLHQWGHNAAGQVWKLAEENLRSLRKRLELEQKARRREQQYWMPK